MHLYFSSLNLKQINDPTNNNQQKVTAVFPIRRSTRKTKNLVNEKKQVALEKSVISQNEDGLKVITILHIPLFFCMNLYCLI